MAYGVKATPIAARQISALRGPRRKAFEAFVTALSVEGCKALGYRLTGAEPLPQLCVKHLRGSDQVVVAFEDLSQRTERHGWAHGLWKQFGISVAEQR